MPFGCNDDIKKEWGNYVLHNFPICMKSIKIKSCPVKSYNICWTDLQKSAESWDIYDFKLHLSRLN